MRESDTTEYDLGQFTKCPDCRRTGTVTFTLHPDGDVTIACSGCGAIAIGHSLNQSDRTYGD